MVLALSFLVVAIAVVSILRLLRPNPSPLASAAETVPSEFQLSPDNFFVGLGEDGFASNIAEAASCDPRLERFVAGDVTALDDALATAGVAGMRRLLDAAVESFDGAPRLFTVASHIAHSRALRATPAFARAVTQAWQTAPTADSLGIVLRMSALADDVPTFKETVETILRVRDTGRLPDLSGEFLITLIETEAALPCSTLRVGSDGFALGRYVSGIRHILSADRRNP